MDWVGRVIDGRYVVESVVGSGGMGVVLAARHKFTGARVAVKMVRKDLGLDAEVEARFLAEARVPAAIGHRGVVQTIDAGKTPEGELYLAMELLVGRSLRAEMQQGPLGLATVRRIGMELLDVLAAAHARGVIHRDVKPENVFLVAPDQSVKLLDFGITKLLTSASSVLPRTQAGVVLGTIAYMAPEQLADARGVDARADLWAVGVILYELIAGRRPYRGATVEDLLRALVQQEPDPIRAALPTATPDLEAFFARALVRDPQRRFASAAEMAQAFAQLAFLPSQPRLATPPAGTSPVTPPAGVSPLGATMASLHPNAAVAAPSAMMAVPQVSHTAQVAPLTGPTPRYDGSTDQIRATGGHGKVWLLVIAAALAAVAGTTLFFHFRTPAPEAAPQVAVSPPPPQGSAAVPAPPTTTPQPPVAQTPQPPQVTTRTAGKPPLAHTGSAGPAPLDPYAGSAAGSSAAAPAVDFCAASCKMLASCHLGSRTCEADCARPGSVQDCLAQAGGDCNRFASCMFGGYCSQLPIGSHSCSEAMDCESSCGGDQVCACTCVQGLAPAHAAAYLGLRGCAAPCRGDTACIAKNCDAQLRRCRAQ